MTNNNKILPQQQGFGKKQSKFEQYKKRVNTELRKLAKEISLENPDFNDFDVIPQVTAYIKTNNNPSNAVYRIAELITWPSNTQKTQELIRLEVQKSFSDSLITKGIWTKSLGRNVLKKVEATIQGNLQSPIDFKGCKTLADFRRRIQTSIRVKDTVKTFNVKIAFSGESVIFNKNSYTLTLDKIGDYTYPRIRVMHKGKRQALRMDLLVEILKQSEL